MRMYTGDDFNLCGADRRRRGGHSDALLGIFDAIAPAAPRALGRLAMGELQGFHGILGRRCAVAPHLQGPDRASTRPALLFLAWLNGLQDHFVMVGGQREARALVHLAELFRLADQARVLHDPELCRAA